jgi:5'-deoxynucleotidase YfbR-like HD superfamily hydrolase
MISPFKAVIGDSYKGVEARLLAAIHIHFGLPVKRTEEFNRLLKAADMAAAYLEATRLAGFADDEARRFFGPPPKLSPAVERDYLTPWSAKVAETRLRKRLESLSRE